MFLCFCFWCLSFSPVVPVLHLEDVKLLEVHFLGLPGGLVVLQLSPLDQVVHVVLPVHAEKHSGDGNSHFLFDLAQRWCWTLCYDKFTSLDYLKSIIIFDRSWDPDASQKDDVIFATKQTSLQRHKLLDDIAFGSEFNNLQTACKFLLKGGRPTQRENPCKIKAE